MGDKSRSFDRQRSERNVLIFAVIMASVLILWVVVVGIIGLR
jgi:hypothetical protein